MGSELLAAKGAAFKAMHLKEKLFVLPNAWDVGTAKMLSSFGFEALATTSAGISFANGRLDKIGETKRAKALSEIKQIVDATPLPVSADLENGFGDSPQSVAETIIRAAEIGLAGCTIEDSTGDPDKPVYDKHHAIERIAAGVEAVTQLDFPFVLTARAENYLYDRLDFDETLERLLGYQEVGADVVYAPGLPDYETIERLCRFTSAPVNVVLGFGLHEIGLKELEEAGVRRISTGSALTRVAYGAVFRALNEIQNSGRFEQLAHGASFAEIEDLLERATQN